MSTSTAPIPDEMKRQGRPVDPHFDADEALYIRFQHLSGQYIEAADLRCPDQSVNRSRYSKAEWVLLPIYAAWGIASLKVQDIPLQVMGGGCAQSFFKVEHDPQEDNYAHSEIRAFGDSTHLHRQSKTSHTVKLQFRTILSQSAIVMRQPSDNKTVD